MVLLAWTRYLSLTLGAMLHPTIIPTALCHLSVSVSSSLSSSLLSSDSTDTDNPNGLSERRRGHVVIRHKIRGDNIVEGKRDSTAKEMDDVRYAVSAADQVFVTAIDLLTSGLFPNNNNNNSNSASTTSPSPPEVSASSTAAMGVRVDIPVDMSRDISMGEFMGVAERECGTGRCAMTSEAEQTVLVCIERLHVARAELLAWIATTHSTFSLFHNSPSSSSFSSHNNSSHDSMHISTTNSISSASISSSSTLQPLVHLKALLRAQSVAAWVKVPQAVQSGLVDFPLNKYVYSFFLFLSFA